MAKKTALQYAIVDLETTGGRPERDRITEIGIVLHNGREITDTWTSLINPGASIPPFISRLTGITQEMVDGAPFFHEVARDIMLRLEHAVFVAHNARFDYHFLRERYRDLGFTFSRPFLCTVKMSREAFPGLSSYSLEHLIRHFDIPAARRHRALDDALATAVLFERVLEKRGHSAEALPGSSEARRQQKLPEQLDPRRLDEVPDECGVYYFRDREGEVLYVGKSIHMRQRMDEHLRDLSRKSAHLDRRIADIDWVVTGSDLAAALLESTEIKRLAPEINRAQRARIYDQAIAVMPSENGYLRLQVIRANEGEPVVQRYAGVRGARSALAAAMNRFQLCRHYSVEYHPGKACFEYQLGTCTGACLEKEPADAYNERVALAAAWLAQDVDGRFFLIDRGPEALSRTIIGVDHGRPTGVGVIEADHPVGTADLESCLRPYPDHPELRRILRQYLAKERYERIPWPEEGPEDVG